MKLNSNYTPHIPLSVATVLSLQFHLPSLTCSRDHPPAKTGHVRTTRTTSPLGSHLYNVRVTRHTTRTRAQPRALFFNAQNQEIAIVRF